MIEPPGKPRSRPLGFNQISQGFGMALGEVESGRSVIRYAGLEVPVLGPDNHSCQVHTQTSDSEGFIQDHEYEHGDFLLDHPMAAEARRLLSERHTRTRMDKKTSIAKKLKESSN